MSAPAVVVGLDLNGLGVVRSLHAAGVSVIALDTDLAKPTCATRCARVERVPSLAGPLLVDSLLGLRALFFEKPVLILTQESAVATVSGARAALEGAYRFALPDDALVRRLQDKLAFQEIVENMGLPIPRAARLEGEAGAAELGKLRFPCVLKPATRLADHGDRLRKAYRVDTACEALRLWQQMKPVARAAIVQEWIEGGDADVYFCLQYRPRDGGAPLSFSGRKLRQWPPLVGGTSACVPAPEAESALTDLTNRFFSALGYTGLASLELKRDRRDGKLYLIEPTVGRTDHQEEIATLNGVNLPLAAYRDALGLAPLPMRAASLWGWRDPVGDAKAREAGSARVPAKVPLRDAYWRASDPLPFLLLHTSGIRRRLKRLVPRQRLARAA